MDIEIQHTLFVNTPSIVMATNETEYCVTDVILIYYEFNCVEYV